MGQTQSASGARGAAASRANVDARQTSSKQKQQQQQRNHQRRQAKAHGRRAAAQLQDWPSQKSTFFRADGSLCRDVELASSFGLEGLSDEQEHGQERDAHDANGAHCEQLVRKHSIVSNRNIQLLALSTGPRGYGSGQGGVLAAHTVQQAADSETTRRRRSSFINMILGSPRAGPRFSEDLCSLNSRLNEFCNSGQIEHPSPEPVIMICPRRKPRQLVASRHSSAAANREPAASELPLPPPPPPPPPSLQQSCAHANQRSFHNGERRTTSLSGVALPPLPPQRAGYKYDAAYEPPSCAGLRAAPPTAKEAAVGVSVGCPKRDENGWHNPCATSVVSCDDDDCPPTDAANASTSGRERAKSRRSSRWSPLASGRLRDVGQSHACSPIKKEDSQQTPTPTWVAVNLSGDLKRSNSFSCFYGGGALCAGNGHSALVGNHERRQDASSGGEPICALASNEVEWKQDGYNSKAAAAAHDDAARSNQSSPSYFSSSSSSLPHSGELQGNLPANLRVMATKSTEVQRDGVGGDTKGPRRLDPMASIDLTGPLEYQPESCNMYSCFGDEASNSEEHLWRLQRSSSSDSGKETTNSAVHTIEKASAKQDDDTGNHRSRPYKFHTNGATSIAPQLEPSEQTVVGAHRSHLVPFRRCGSELSLYSCFGGLARQAQDSCPTMTSGGNHHHQRTCCLTSAPLPNLVARQKHQHASGGHKFAWPFRRIAAAAAKSAPLHKSSCRASTQVSKQRHAKVADHYNCRCCSSLVSLPSASKSSAAYSTYSCASASTSTYSFNSSSAILSSLTMRSSQKKSGQSGCPTSASELLRRQTKLIILLQVCLPFILAGFGNLAAGLAFSGMSQWRSFREAPTFLVLLPSFVGLKGNIEMTLASRLSTLSNLNLLETSYQRRQAYVSNLMLMLCHAISLSTFATFASVACDFMINGGVDSSKHSLAAMTKVTATSGANSTTNEAHIGSPSSVFDAGQPHFHLPITHQALLVVLPCALITSFILVVISSIIVWWTVWLAKRIQVNPDNLSTLVAALYGDVTCVLSYGLFANWMHCFYINNIRLWPILIIFISAISLFLVTWAAFKFEGTQTSVISSIPPTLASILVSLGSGTILSLVLDRFHRIALYQPVVNGFGANLIAAQASRISTWLWCDTISRMASRRNSATIANNGHTNALKYRQKSASVTNQDQRPIYCQFEPTTSPANEKKTSPPYCWLPKLTRHSSDIEKQPQAGQQKWHIQLLASKLGKIFNHLVSLAKIILWSFCNPTPNSTAAKLLLLTIIPAHTLYFLVISLLSPAKFVVITWQFYLVYMALCLTQVFILLLICEPLMRFLMKYHMDPDVFGIALLMSLADLIGTLCLTGGFEFLAKIGDINAKVGSMVV